GDAEGSAVKLVPLPPQSADEPRVRARADGELVAACAEGDEGALGELFDRHSASLSSFLARAASRSAIDLDDLVQQTFLLVWRSAARFAGGSSVRTWILG